MAGRAPWRGGGGGGGGGGGDTGAGADGEDGDGIEAGAGAPPLCPAHTRNTRNSDPWSTG